MLGIANDYDTLAVRAALCASSIARTLIRNAASEALPYRSSCLLLRTVSLSGRLLCGLRMHLSLGLLEIHRAARLGAKSINVRRRTGPMQSRWRTTTSWQRSPARVSTALLHRTWLWTMKRISRNTRKKRSGQMPPGSTRRLRSLSCRRISTPPSRCDRTRPPAVRSCRPWEHSLPGCVSLHVSRERPKLADGDGRVGGSAGRRLRCSQFPSATAWSGTLWPRCHPRNDLVIQRAEHRDTQSLGEVLHCRLRRGVVLRQRQVFLGDVLHGRLRRDRGSPATPTSARRGSPATPSSARRGSLMPSSARRRSPRRPSSRRRSRALSTSSTRSGLRTRFSPARPLKIRAGFSRGDNA
jgi:hypothetical protein